MSLHASHEAGGEWGAPAPAGGDYGRCRLWPHARARGEGGGSYHDDSFCVIAAGPSYDKAAFARVGKGWSLRGGAWLGGWRIMIGTVWLDAPPMPSSMQCRAASNAEQHASAGRRCASMRCPSLATAAPRQFKSARPPTDSFFNAVGRSAARPAAFKRIMPCKAGLSGRFLFYPFLPLSLFPITGTSARSRAAKAQTPRRKNHREDVTAGIGSSLGRGGGDRLGGDGGDRIGSGGGRNLKLGESGGGRLG
jgi:hypothetical protein